MERPHKRQRLSKPPELDLSYRREQNDRRLKSTFEAIFDKYGKDFDGVGDEIDLETGEIVINNGHVQGMTDERDPGDQEDESEYDSDDWSEQEGVLASSLLLESRRRLGALEHGELLQRPDYVDDELSLEGDVDSLMGDHESLVEEPILPPTRGTSFPPDSHYEEGTEDELASSDPAWPTPARTCSTPRKVWPTPKKMTPLSHTPWRSSPVKPVHVDKPPVDPVWKAPPLPTRSPSQFPKATDDKVKVPAPRHPPGNHSRAVLSLPISPERSPELSNSRISKSAADNGNQPKNTRRHPKARWTEEEENRLVRLRTTTTMKYSEIQRYFPSRKMRAIMLHWSDMTRNIKDMDQFLRRYGSEDPVASSNSTSPRKHGGNETTADADILPSVSSTATPDPESHQNDDPDPQNPDSCPDLSSGSFSPKVEGNSTRHEPENPNRRESRESEGVDSTSRHNSSNQSPYGESTRKVFTPDLAREEQCEVHEIPEKTPSQAESKSPTVTVKPLNAAEAPQLSYSLYGIRPDPSEPSNPTNFNHKSLNNRAPNISLPSNVFSDVRQLSSVPSRKPFFLPSYISDESDDELSTPVKTVGAGPSIDRPASIVTS